MKQKYLLLSIIIFIFLALFSATSLALIPGDFGSANNGPPDGCVDFEDLMIFAMAYGSTPSDSNWNPSCDIAGFGGVLEPDGKIDFEDLMIFALHYGECESCTPPSPPILYDPGTTLQSPATYTVSWSVVSGATSYKIQESTSSSFSGAKDYTTTSTNRSFSHTVSSTTTYYYRVAAINDCGQSNWSNIENIKIILSSVYRAFLVGVGDYQYFPDAYGNTDLPAPPYDVDRMYDTLTHSGNGFSSINKLIDLQATKKAILNGIANTFSGAESNDVSYFYFSGHGMNSNGVSYLCPTDISYSSPLSSYISTNELKSALSAISGTKVVILDCCYSGGFIGKQIGEETISTNPEDFNNNVINVFLSKHLTGSQYKVLTSCLSTQVCVELIPAEGDPFGLFSGVLCVGFGYDTYIHPYPADGNGNGKITLHEAYTYTDEQVTIITTELNNLYGWNIEQDTQVYPLYSDFVIIEE